MFNRCSLLHSSKERQTNEENTKETKCCEATTNRRKWKSRSFTGNGENGEKIIRFFFIRARKKKLKNLKIRLFINFNCCNYNRT